MENQFIYSIADEEIYHDGQVIFKEGNPGDWVYVILSGSVEISRIIRGEKYIIEILQPGEVFGELGFLGGIKRTATAMALGDTSLGLIDRGFLEKEYNQLSGQFRGILKILTLRFRKMVERSCDFTRRAEPRYPATLLITYKHRQDFLRDFTSNISSGGLSVRTAEPLDTGTQFLLKLQLPDVDNPLQIKCEVIWSRKPVNTEPGQPSGMGLKFSQMSKRDYQLLKKYLAVEGTK